MTIKPANVRTQTQSRPWTIVLSIASEIDDKLPFDIGVREIEKYWKRQRNLSVLKGSEWWKGKFYLWSSSRCAPCIVWRVFRLNFVILFPLGGVLWQKKLNFLRPPLRSRKTLSVLRWKIFVHSIGIKISLIKNPISFLLSLETILSPDLMEKRRSTTSRIVLFCFLLKNGDREHMLLMRKGRPTTWKLNKTRWESLSRIFHHRDWHHLAQSGTSIRVCQSTSISETFSF